MATNNNGGLRQRAPRTNQTVSAKVSSRAVSRAPSLFTVPGVIPLSLGLFLGACLLAVVCLDKALPTPLPASTTPLHQFSEERARTHLDTIVNFGVRTTGNYANEVKTVDYILGVVEQIKTQASTPGFVVELSVQHPSGSFHLDFIGGFNTVYQNVTNLLVRVYYKTAAPDPTTHALLLSAHYDTALGTAAASDNAANVANLLEVLRALSHSKPVRHAIIFNFNGAEETILQASHGFITQHEWSSSVRAFINLEGAGGSGRELVFQTGPRHAWLARAYANYAPYPFASIIAQEVFQSGLVPSDTDFRVYRDFGHIPGLDIAYITDGYVYHTTLDDLAHVKVGSLQRTGENVLAVTLHLADSALLAETPLHADEVAIYFDVLGMFAVVYSAQIAFFLNLTTAAAVLLVMSSKGWLSWQVVASGGVSLLSLFAGVAAPAAVGVLLTVMPSGSMAWYAHSWLMVGLYACPSFLAMAAVQRWFHDKRYRRSGIHNNASSVFDRSYVEHEWAVEHRSYLGGILAWTVLLVVLTLLNMGSAYLPLQWVVWPLLARWLVHSPIGPIGNSMSAVAPVSVAQPVTKKDQDLGLRGSNNNNSDDVGDDSDGSSSSSSTTKTWSRGSFLLWYFGGLALPVACFAMPLIWNFLLFFVPVMGRAGTEVPGDIALGVLVGAVVSLLFLVAGSLIHLDGSWHRTRLVLVAVTAACLVVAALSNPYSPATPKRLYVQHIARSWHTETGALSYSDSGLWLLAIDQLNMKPIAAQVDLANAVGPALASAAFDASSRNRPLLIDCMHPAHKAPPPSNLHNMLAGSIYCDVPFYFPVRDMVTKSLYLRDSLQYGPPNVPESAQLQVKLLSRDLVSSGTGTAGNVYRFEFELNGPDHMALYLDATRGPPVAWSIDPPPHRLVHSVSPSYFIYFAAGKDLEGGFSLHHTWRIWFEVAETRLPLRFSVAAQYLSEQPDAHTTSFLQSLPDWVSPISWVSLWQRHDFGLASVPSSS